MTSFDTSNVENMYGMFGESAFETIDISSFDTGNVRNMSAMFAFTVNVEEFDLSSFDMSNVENTYGMFYGTSSTIGYTRTQEDADILNATELKPEYLIFTVKKALKEILNLFTPEIDDFGDVFITNKRQFVSTEIAHVIVEDWRETSNNWSLSISASPLRRTDDAFELPEGTLSLKGVSHIEKLNGGGVLPMKRLTGKTAIDESKVVLVEGENSKGSLKYPSKMKLLKW